MEYAVRLRIGFEGNCMQLRMSNRVSNGVTIIDCNGRIVFGEEAAALRETVKAMIPQNPKMILNLKNITYIDSGGLGTLVGLHTSAHGSGADIKLANLTPRVGQLLQVTKLVTVFEVYDTEEDALRAFSKAAARAS
jgi:anti-sigma B factor antagonist